MGNVALALGSLFAMLGVALGAFGAHALRGKLTGEQLAVYQTGVQYQMYHALGLLAMGIYAKIVVPSGWLESAMVLMTVGVILFSGSLYTLTLTGQRAWGAVTPIGGISWIAAWILFTTAVIVK